MSSPSQYDIFRVPDGTLVVVLQSDFMAESPTRVVAPLVPEQMAPGMFSRMMPVVLTGDSTLRLFPHQMATLPVKALTRYIGSAAHLRDDITRALDMLFTGH